MKNFILKIFILLILINGSLSKAEINLEAKTAILQDFLSEKILYEKDPDYHIYPASMTKIMTTIIAFELLQNGEISLDEKFLVSKKAWRLSNPNSSSMFIMVGDDISVENLLRGIIIVSGNDACMALAEGISGSEEEFVILMNAKAKEIGMQNTNFANSHGLNEPPGANVSTVRDIMMMSNYLIKHYPEYYSYFSEEEFTWYRTGGDPIPQPNTNILVTKDIGVDGIKTGFLTVEKYSLASSILRNGRRLIAVGSGFQSKRSRADESKNLLIYGLTNFDTIELVKKNEVFSSLNVWLGKKEKIEIYTKEDIYITVPKRKKKLIKAYIEYSGPIEAPIEKDSKLGELLIYYDDTLFKRFDVFSTEQIKKLNIFSRLIKSFNYMLWGDV